MKIFPPIAVVMMLGASVFGQGQIFFNNRSTVGAAVYGLNPAAPTVRLSGNSTTNGGTVNYSGIPLISGTNWTAQLWYGAAGSPMDALQPVTSPQGTVTFRPSGPFDGFIQQTAAAATLDGIPFGSVAQLQMRIWDNRGGLITSWAQALAYQQIDPGLLTGFSDKFTSVVLVPPPDVPPGMTGLTSFSLSSLSVPEPSVIALGTLGLSALLLRRRQR
jgi:hypothetical protein